MDSVEFRWNTVDWVNGVAFYALMAYAGLSDNNDRDMFWDVYFNVY